MGTDSVTGTRPGQRRGRGGRRGEMGWGDGPGAPHQAGLTLDFSQEAALPGSISVRLRGSARLPFAFGTAGTSSGAGGAHAFLRASHLRETGLP